MTRTLTAALLVTAALLTNGAFTALGLIFDYPDVLKQPTAEVLANFRSHRTAVSAGFVLLALSAALFAPIAVGVGRLATNRWMRMAVPVGIAAAVVQVIGLLRWPLLVPALADAATSPDPTVVAEAETTFRLIHTVLGHVVGETFGYLFTAAWTLLVLAGVGGRLAGRWFTGLGALAAGLILVGIASPLDLPLVDQANFVGYVLWSVWLVVFAALLLRRPRPAAADHGTAYAGVRGGAA